MNSFDIFVFVILIIVAYVYKRDLDEHDKRLKKIEKKLDIESPAEKKVKELLKKISK